VVIWTRITPEQPASDITCAYVVSTDTAFSSIVASGTTTTTADRDYTVKVAVTGLEPSKVYYYYFQALGANSLIGRARTTPIGAVDHLRFAVVSCSNYEGGFFNVYDAIAQRNDLDAVLHLGDYIYEYGAGTYGINLPNRVNVPENEILTLADYRTRYSLYRLDPDMIRIHQQQTFITVWDDHESANDSYVDGAENHQPDEGPWEVRKAVSKKVYFEWMPVRDHPDEQVYRKFSYGNLADLFMLDTRLEGRVQPPPNFDTPDTPPRNMISAQQYDWLVDGLKNTTSAWKIIGNQILFSTTNVGFAAGPLLTNIESIRELENLFIDNWESYPTQRNSIIDSLRTVDVQNVVIVTGDSHASWAFDVTKEAVLYPLPQFSNLPQPNPYNPITREGYNPVTGEGSWAVEFGTPSVSSPNFDEAVGSAAAAQFEFLINNPVPPIGAVYNPHLKYVDLDRHGYFLLDVRPDAVQADFHYTPTVAVDTFGDAFGQGVRTLSGSRRVTLTSIPSTPKTNQAAPAPAKPLPYTSSTPYVQRAASIISAYPNPANRELYVQIGFQKATRAAIRVYDAAGRPIAVGLEERPYEAGIYNLMLSLEGLPNGTYTVRTEGTEVSSAVRIVVQR
jgi:alkaline phosphatase D